MRWIGLGCLVVGLVACEPETSSSEPQPEPEPGTPVIAPEDSCQAAAKVGEPDLELVGAPYQREWGSQGGSHVDIRLWMAGISPGAPTVPGYSGEELGWPLVTAELYEEGSEPRGYPSLTWVWPEGTAQDATATVRMYDPYDDDLRIRVTVEDACGNLAELDGLLQVF